MNERIWHRSYDDGIPPDLEFEQAVLPDLLHQAVTGFPDNPAIHFMNRTMTYRELNEHTERFATALARLGIGKDNKVAVHMPNLPQTAISVMAVLSLGAQVVMTNPLYAGPEIVHQWNDAGCEAAVVTDFLYDRLLMDLRAQLPVRNYIVASIPDYLRFPLRQLAPLKLRKASPPLIARVERDEGVHFFTELIRSTAAEPPAVSIAPGDLAFLQYTGGTTGVAKGAMLTHGNITSNVQQIVAWFPDTVPGREVMMAALPLFHIFGLTVAMMWAWKIAAALVLAPNPRDIPGLIKAITKHRVTIFPGVPAMFNAINQHPGIDKIDISSIKNCFSGSAPLPPAVLERFEGMTGCRIVEGFGLTESSPVTHCNPLKGVRKIGSIGIPLPGTDARIVDPEDFHRQVDTGTEGELVISGPQVMKGYWNRPDETGQALPDGWLCTGDLAAIDDDGYFKIVGRKKDMIIASGYNIFPDEIDRELASHPAVLEACTIGVPDPKRGESVKSFIVLRPDGEASEDELRDFLLERLARYKVPRIFEFRDELPKSSMLKLLRRELRDEEMRKLEKNQPA